MGQKYYLCLKILLKKVIREKTKIYKEILCGNANTIIMQIKSVIKRDIKEIFDEMVCVSVVYCKKSGNLILYKKVASHIYFLFY